jgi:DNA topoisomerase-6 subunit B
LANQITSSSTAEYFAKNLQQVGFSSPTKAVLTTLKESVDNSLDACEMHDVLPELTVEINRLGPGSQKNTDLIQVIVEDNGPGIDPDDLPKVFGEYLASSKFGRGQCSRGQQGIGISAATTWAQLTNAQGVVVTTKTKTMRKAVRAVIDVDIKRNSGVARKKETIDWDRPSGTRVEFRLDGRVQVNGDGGVLTYLEGTTLVNPHLTLNYKLLELPPVHIDRVTTVVPQIPGATNPHPHTMKLGEFMTHASLFGKVTFSKWMKTSFSRVSDSSISDFVKKGLAKSLVEKPLSKFSEEDFKSAFKVVQETDLMSPSTKSVLTVGEDALSKSIQRLGAVDFMSVVTRKPRICDFKPVVVEVTLARFTDRGSEDQPVQVLRFANRVPLQFDKAACAITQAIESVNWRTYGLNQPKESVPLGPYVFAISVVSPFIKFKNASKETIDASEELVEEIRRALIQAGQKLSRYIRWETKQADLEQKIRHIEQFGPILVDGLVRMTKASDKRKKAAEAGLRSILGRDAAVAEEQVQVAETRRAQLIAKEAGAESDVIHIPKDEDTVVADSDAISEAETEAKINKAAGKSATKAAGKAVVKSGGKSAGKTVAKATKKLAHKPAAKVEVQKTGSKKSAPSNVKANLKSTIKAKPAEKTTSKKVAAKSTNKKA